MNHDCYGFDSCKVATADLRRLPFITSYKQRQVAVFPIALLHSIFLTNAGIIIGQSHSFITITVAILNRHPTQAVVQQTTTKSPSLMIESGKRIEAEKPFSYLWLGYNCDRTGFILLIIIVRKWPKSGICRVITEQLKVLIHWMRLTRQQKQDYSNAFKYQTRDQNA